MGVYSLSLDFFFEAVGNVDSKYFTFFFSPTVLALKNSRGSDGGLTLDEFTEVEGLMSMGKPLPKPSGFLALGEVSTSQFTCR